MDYVYIPLGGSYVKSKWRIYFNLFIVWLLTGIWHGANWNFVLWGLFNFAWIIFEKNLNRKEIGHSYALLVVMIGWVIFRTNNISDAGVYLMAMFGNAQAGFVDTGFVDYVKYNSFYYMLAIICCTPCIAILDRRFKEIKVWNIGYTIGMIVIFCVSIIFIMNQAYDPFIYFNF